VQSVALERGPLARALRLANVHVHTVAGPISARLGALDAGDAQRLFRDAAVAAVAAARADRTHRWRAAEG
jgi:putative membrane protein